MKEAIFLQFFVTLDILKFIYLVQSIIATSTRQHGR
jgi:hypothetical protein